MYAPCKQFKRQAVSDSSQKCFGFCFNVQYATALKMKYSIVDAAAKDWIECERERRQMEDASEVFLMNIIGRWKTRYGRKMYLLCHNKKEAMR